MSSKVREADRTEVYLEERWEADLDWGGQYSQTEGCCGEGGGRGGSCLGTHVHPSWIHVNVWQNQYSIVK